MRRRPKSKSGYWGVSWIEGSNKWRVSLRNGPEHIHVGLYSDIIEAAKAYDIAKLAKYNGQEQIRLNFPKDKVQPPPSGLRPLAIGRQDLFK